MHSKLLGDQQSCLQQDDKDRERLCSDIQEELQVLTELAEMLIKREDAKTFKLLMERLSEPFGQALDIQDRIPPGQDFQFGPNDFGLVGIYTVSTIGELIDCVDSFAVKTRSQISQTESEDRKKKWSQFEQDWIGPISTTATSLLDMCLRANTTEPLEAVLGILQDLQKPFGSEFIRSHLELWGYNVAMCIQKLDRAAHASGLHARAQKSGPIVFQDEKREHMRVLMDGLRDVIWDCFRHNVDQRLKILDSIVLRTSYDMEAAAPMLKHWGESKEAIRLNSSHLDFVRGITWAAFFEIGGNVFQKKVGRYQGCQKEKDFVEFAGKFFNLETKYGNIKDSFLEDILQYVWLQKKQRSECVVFWLWLRIYLAENLKIWPVTKWAPARSLDRGLVAALDRAIGQMTGDTSIRILLTGVDRDKPEASQLATTRVNAALDGLRQAFHPSDDS